ncbi:MAG: zinc ribbon domain-containing protein [Bacteroidetes bacterium]|nr:zinc ribbon domain-containing protein [Bacteroidota bacterium]
MPTYEYKCKSCNYLFEELQSMKDDPLKICPKCKKRKLERLVSGGSGMIFKGSGFYLTDYKNAQKKSVTKESLTTSKETKTASSEKPKSDKKS